MSKIKKLNKKQPLRLGFIGGGLSSTIGEAHYTASHLDGHWQLNSGFFSRKKSVNYKTAKSWNVSLNRTYESLNKFISKETYKLDAVVVLTPTPNHYETILKLVKKKIPIICEKPLVSSLKQAKIIQKLIKKSNGFLTVTYNYTGYPMVRELRQRVINGSLGKIKQIHFEMPQDGLIRSNSKIKKWRLYDEEIPTICLDLGVHLHNLAYFILEKEPKKVMANFFNSSRHKKIIDNVLMWLEYKNGIKGSFWMSKTAIGNRNGLRLRIFGDKGSAEWIQNNSEELRLSYKNGTREILDRASKSTISSKKRYNRYKAGHPAGFIEAFANLYFDIADNLNSYNNRKKNKSIYVFDLDHSLRGLELFAASCKSNRSRNWQKINYSNRESYFQ
jgi:predicted dehydrogenase